MLLTRIHATTAPLFEDVIIKRLWRSPSFTSCWVTAIARKHFSLADELTRKEKQKTSTRPLSRKSCACCWRWCLYGSFQAKAWTSSPALEQATAVHVLSRDTGGIQVSQRQQKPTAFIWSSGVFQHWRVCACLLYRRLFVYLTSPSAHLWECCYPAWGLAVPSIFNDVHTNPSELFKCHFIHLPPNSSFIHRLP